MLGEDVMYRAYFLDLKTVLLNTLSNFVKIFDFRGL